MRNEKTEADLIKAFEALLGHGLLQAVANARVSTMVDSNAGAYCLQGEQRNCGGDSCRQRRWMHDEGFMARLFQKHWPTATPIC